MTASPLHLLDTNMVTYIVSGRSHAARLRLKEALTHHPVSVSAITQAEILFGLENKLQATRLRSAVADLFAILPILAWDSAAAHAYAGLRARLASAGKSLSSMDMLIAAHATAASATLVTHDKAFRHAEPMLDIVDWATDL